jgi:transcriptional regulator with XRE-family HTH domain
MQDTRAWREELGWSQWQLSTATGIDRTRLSLIECQHVTPNAEESTAIQRALLEGTRRKKEILTSAEESAVSA